MSENLLNSDEINQTPEDAHIERRSGSIYADVTPTTSDLDLVKIIASASEDKHRPWEKCVLPSRGLLYPTWKGIETCQVRPFGIDTDKILATQRLAQSGEAIDRVFTDSCRFPDNNFDPLDLLAGDRIFLLYYLRGITYGNIYEFVVNCPRPDCKAPQTHSCNISALASTIKWLDPMMGTEPYKVELPFLTQSTKRSVWASVRFMRGRDSNNMIAMRKLNSKMFDGRSQRREPTIDDTLTENLEAVIVDINGVTDRSIIKAIVSKMHATDTATIRQWLNNNSPGMDTTTEIQCTECGGSFKVPLPITESFFRPTQG